MKKQLGLFTFFLFVISIARPVWAQLNEPLILSADNPLEEVTIQITDVAEVNFIRLTAYDPDFEDEGQFFINGVGPIPLFPGANGVFDGQVRAIDIVLTRPQKAALVEGANVFRFAHLRSGGYEIRGITAVGDISLETYEAAPVNPNATSDAARYRALQLYQRLVGVKTSIDNPKIVQMANLMQQGRGIEAAQIATAEPGFYNNVVRDFGARMATIEQTAGAPLSDLVATVIGVTRDGVDARELLTGSFFYMANSEAPVPQDILEDVVKSNNHYTTLESDGYDFASVLARVDNQYLRGPNDQLFEAMETAGVMTSRAFMEAHGVAGTNRRLVEYTMKVFACAPVNAWADARSPDIYVARDVDRFPGGDPEVFKTQCKSCHGNMDGFRGAFARYDFSDGFTKYTLLYPDSNREGQNVLPQEPLGVVAKYNRNADVFPGGHVTTDNSWQNFARSPDNQQLFGWRAGADGGQGVNSLGQAVANSKAFSQCMVKKVYREICNRETSVFEIPMIESLSNEFEQEGYQIKPLFEKISVRPECAGK
jgi:hypothetical protein